MRVVRPVQITEPRLISSNVPIDDAPAWAANTTYAIGDQVIYGLTVYEDTVGGDSGATPPGTSSMLVQRWFPVSPVNRWRMFQKKVGNRWPIGLSTSNAEEIDVTVKPGTVVNSIGLVGIVGKEVEIIMTVPVQGVVYSKVYNLNAREPTTNWYQHWFGLFTQRTTLVDFYLPAYGNAEIQIIVRAPDSIAKIGTFVVGSVRKIGHTLVDTTIDPRNLSRVTEQPDGTVEIISRGRRRTVRFNVDVPRANTDSVVEFLDSINDEPTLFVGAEELDSLTVVGWMRESPFAFPNIAMTRLNLEVWRL